MLHLRSFVGSARRCPCLLPCRLTFRAWLFALWVLQRNINKTHRLARKGSAFSSGSISRFTTRCDTFKDCMEPLSFLIYVKLNMYTQIHVHKCIHFVSRIFGNASFAPFSCEWTEQVPEYRLGSVTRNTTVSGLFRALRRPSGVPRLQLRLQRRQPTRTNRLRLLPLSLGKPGLPFVWSCSWSRASTVDNVSLYGSGVTNISRAGVYSHTANRRWGAG